MVHVCGLAVLLLLSIWWEAHAIDDTNNLQDCVDDPHWSSQGIMCKDIKSPRLCPYTSGAEEKCCKCMETNTSTTTSSTNTTTTTFTRTTTTCLDNDSGLRKSTGLTCKDLTRPFCPAIPDAGKFCCMCQTQLRKCDLSTGTLLKTLTGHRDAVMAVSADFNKQRAISGSHDQTLKVWDLSTGTVLKTLTGDELFVTALSADFSKQRAISGSADKTLRVWDLSAGTVLKALTGHRDTVWAVSADFNKQRAISGSGDKTLKVWDLSTGTVLKTLTGHRLIVTAVSADFNKQRAISGSADKTLKVWDLSSGTVLKTLTGHRSIVEAASADFSKQLAISGSGDTTLKVWDLSTGTLLKTLTGHREFIDAVSADFNKQRAISGSEDKTLKVWRLCMDAKLNATSSKAGLRERTSNMLKLGTSAPATGVNEKNTIDTAWHDGTIKETSMKKANHPKSEGTNVAATRLSASIPITLTVIAGAFIGATTTFAVWHRCGRTSQNGYMHLEA